MRTEVRQLARGHLIDEIVSHFTLLYSWIEVTETAQLQCIHAGCCNMKYESPLRET